MATTRKRAPARSKTTKKPIAARARALRGVSSGDLRFVLSDVKRTDMGGKQIGLTKRQRKPAAMEMNRRHRAGRQSVEHFHPESFAYSELEAIVAGRGGEAWTFVMRRNDVPLKAREMARAEMKKRRK